jgi:hypothetical protein
VPRIVRLTVVAAILGTLSAALVAMPAGATPPNIPSKATAQSELNTLTVATQGSMSGYSRDKFPHWITISGSLRHPGDRAAA